MGRSCLKFVIVFFNTPLMLVGLAALGTGAWILAKDKDFLNESTDILDLNILGSDLMENCAWTMIAAGVGVFVLGAIGCAGAFALSSFVLAFYSVVMILFLALEVAVIVLGLVFRSELIEKADDKVKDRLLTEYGNGEKTFTKSFNALQDELDCCGWDSGKDFAKVDRNVWNVTMESTTDKRQVPDECCQSSNQTLVLQCVLKPFDNNPIYSNVGCKSEVEDKFEKYIRLIIGITAGLLAFQFLLICLALCLVVQVEGKKYNM